MIENRSELEALLAERARRNPTPTFKSLEDLLTNRELFGLTTATKLQRAICRIADGKPLEDLYDDPGVANAIGDTVGLPPGTKPREIVILSGIRVGKSLLAALLAIYWSQTCDVSRLGPGEIPRISIVSITRDLAEVIFGHITGRLLASDKLKKLIINQPTADCVVLRHPTGIPIEITVASGSRAGSSLVARWSAGCIFDEFPRMNGEEDGVINWDDSRRAVLERILPGAQLVSVGSPWAPRGPAFEVWSKHGGKPNSDICVIKAPAWEFNPYFWTPEKIEQTKANPDIYQTDCLAEFADPEETMFSSVEIDSCTRASPIILPFDSRFSYRAAMDPATRGNGWTFCVVTRYGNIKRVVLTKQWVGTKVVPLSPREVMAEIATICKMYDIKTIDTDIYLSDAIRDISRDYNIHIRQINLNDKEKSRKYITLKTKLAMQEIELPPDRVVRNDLLHVKKRRTTNGLRMVLPRTADGRHCDFVPAIVLALGSYLDDIQYEEVVDSKTLTMKLAEKLKTEQFNKVKEQQEKNKRSGMPWRNSRR